MSWAEVTTSECGYAAAGVDAVAAAVGRDVRCTRFTMFQLASVTGSSRNAVFTNASRTWTIRRPRLSIVFNPCVAPPNAEIAARHLERLDRRRRRQLRLGDPRDRRHVIAEQRRSQGTMGLRRARTANVLPCCTVA